MEPGFESPYRYHSIDFQLASGKPKVCSWRATRFARLQRAGDSVMRETTEHLISRIDHNYFHGWLVSITRRGKRLEKYFSDRPHGRHDARRKARQFRDRLLATLAPPTKVKTRFSLNTSGVIGVTLSRDLTRAGRVAPRYLATWPTRDGRRAKVSFSIGRYGKAEAFRLAVQAREQGLQKELGQASLSAPSKKPWKRRTGRDR